ncbi:SPJ_0845 family protein [Ligilactobacillus ruminis]
MGLKVNRQTNLETLFDQFAVIEPEKTEKNKEKADKSQKTESKKEDKK